MNARGLFRATGNSSKPVATRDLITGEYSKVEFLEREKDDFYPTPSEPIQAIISAEYNNLKRYSSIWECACGDGAISKILNEAGFETYNSDMIDRGFGAELKSFYDFKDAPSKAILTNPPFKDCNTGDWIRHAMDTLGVEYMALLLPLNWMGAITRGKLWAMHTPARVYLMRWRIDFTGQGAPPMLNAWYVWDKAHEGETALRMLDRSDPLQEAMEV